MAKQQAKQTAPASKLDVVYRPVTALKPDPRNPRRHSRRQIRQIANSIEAFGFGMPITIDGRHQIVAGHGRLAACQLLGWVEVPTICLAHLSPDQVRALQIADNRLTDSSSWDEQLLNQTLLELSQADLDFSIEATGFDMGEIDWRIAGISEPAEEDDPADQVPALQATAVSSVGDIWVLGSHRVVCGDALKPETMAMLLEGEKARLLFTDPPYNVRIHGHVSGLGAHQHREFAMGSGEMSAAQFSEFLLAALGQATSHLIDGGIAFVCMDWRHVADVVATVGKLGAELKNICVWAKHNAGMGSLYRSGHELVVVSKHGSAPHVNNVQLGRHGRSRTNVWRYPGANSPGARHGKEGDLLALHPTPKPVALVADAILDCSNRGDVVLDNFLGSGTTVIAAERTGRRCFGVELDPLYVDAAIRRFQTLTKQPAVHAVTGQTFDMVASGHGVAAGEWP
jgi:DNA modification methylase